ncbi:hypothetical protein BDV96DRAFT_600213 [Lophiotrema nucula]|uniref:Mid2 domain-containing protein n=1 Tax=Lophiotrema nucula TaxID=690887 RepID=A0A6A5Z9L1_9PLEO|nr:hypothetical protein BDV96DRAFT_600213 [Lophiotrema nucula]
MSLVAVLFSAFTFYAVAFAASNSTCYYPAGLENRGIPCNPDAEVSSCCGPGFVCLSNGLCTPGKDDKKTYRYKYYRSGCTDPTWNSTDCPQYCLDVLTTNEASDSLDAGEGIQSCGSNSYCCNKNYDCCSNSTNVFTLGTANIVRTIPYFSSTSTSSSSPSSSASIPPAPSHSGNKSNGVAIGVGVGVGIGGLAVAILAVFMLLRRRKNRQKFSQHRTAAQELDPDQAALQPHDSKDRYDLAPQDEGPGVPEMHAEPKAQIPHEPQELAPQDRFEMATLSGGEKGQKRGERREGDHQGRFFKEEGVYRHEVAG